MKLVPKNIIVGLKNGDNSAFKVLYDYYSPYIYNLAFRLLKDSPSSEEIVQDTFVKLWVSRDKIDVDKDIWSFLYVIAKHLCLNQLRNSLSVKNYIRQLEENVADDIQDKIFASELEKFLMHKISSLPPKQRLAIELSRINGRSHAEIAKEMGISTNTVKNHITQGLVQLRRVVKTVDYRLLKIISLFLIFH